MEAWNCKTPCPGQEAMWLKRKALGPDPANATGMLQKTLNGNCIDETLPLDPVLRTHLAGCCVLLGRTGASPSGARGVVCGVGSGGCLRIANALWKSAPDVRVIHVRPGLNVNRYVSQHALATLGNDSPQFGLSYCMVFCHLMRRFRIHRIKAAVATSAIALQRPETLQNSLL